MDLCRLALHVVLHTPSQRRHVGFAPVRTVNIPIRLPAVASIDAREFVAAVVDDRLRQPAGRAMERPSNQGVGTPTVRGPF